MPKEYNMSFFDDLFGKPLPGGTPSGNLLRKVANEVSGGLLGNGALKITQVDYDIENLNDADYIAKYGKTKTGVPVEGVKPNSSIMAIDQQLRSGVNAKSSFWVTLVGLCKRFWWLVLPLLILLIGWLFSLLSGRNSKSKKKKYTYGKKR